MTSEDTSELLRTALTRRRFLAGVGAGALTLALPGCGSSGNSGSGSKGPVKIGDKGFTEEYLIADMYQLLLQKNGIPVSRHSYGSAAIAHKALTHGDIDLYPEYTGTGLLEILKMSPMSDANRLYDTVKSEYDKRFKLTWLDQSPMNDTQAIAVTSATAKKYKIKTMSDIGNASNQLTFVGLAECVGRADCLIGLKKTYGMNFKNVITTTSPALNYKALLDGKADVSEVFSTDGQIAAYNLVVPLDDKSLWPPYHVAPVVRNDALKARPEIRTILNKLAPKITSHQMSALNAQVDLKKKDHMAVARAWLKSGGLL